MKVKIGKSKKSTTKKSSSRQQSKEQRLKEAIDRAKRTSKGGDFFKLEVGKTERFIVLPGLTEDDNNFVLGGQHYSATAEGKPVGCPNITLGKRCPICDVLDETASVDPKNKVVGKSRVQNRYYYNVLKLDKGESPQQGLISIGNQTFLQICDLDSEDAEEDGYGDISNPNDALPIRIKREGKKWNETKYFVTPGNKRIDLEAEYPEEFKDWMKNRRNLDELVASFIPDDEQLEAIAERMQEEIDDE